MNVLQQWTDKLDACNIDPQTRKEILEILTDWYERLQNKKPTVYVTVTVYEGCLDNIKVFSTSQKASDWCNWAKDVLYKDVLKNTEIVIKQKEVDPEKKTE